MYMGSNIDDLDVSLDIPGWIHGYRYSESSPVVAVAELSSHSHTIPSVSECKSVGVDIRNSLWVSIVLPAFWTDVGSRGFEIGVPVEVLASGADAAHGGSGSSSRNPGET